MPSRLGSTECQARKAMIQEVKKAIERMHRLTGMPRSEIVSASGGVAELQHQLGRVLINPAL